MLHCLNVRLRRRKRTKIMIGVVGFFLLCAYSTAGAYSPAWASLDKRPLPAWYDEAKFGIFMHWGLYSVPGIMDAWFWWDWQGKKDPEAVQFMRDNYRPGFTYADFGPQFTAEFFDPDTFARLIKDSGAKYFVLTSKHHEGFTMWPSKYAWNWNSMDLGPRRDVVDELRSAINNISGVHFGLYFSQFEFFNPLYLKDKANKFQSQEYVEMVSIPQMYEIVNMYRPDVIWSDGDWEAPFQYWNSTEFIAWLYNSSPVKETVVVNDRWGVGTTCKHGDFFTCQDKYDPGHLLPHKWENAMTVDRDSWGFRRTMRSGEVLSIQQLITKLARTISCGGNLLLNVGPTHDGRIVPIFEERLHQMGSWLRVNGEAVFATKPWIHQNDTLTPNIWFTSRLRSKRRSNPLYNHQSPEETIVYAFVLSWPPGGTLHLGAALPTQKTKVSLLGYPGRLFYKPRSHPASLIVELGTIPWDQLPSTWAWVLKLEYLAPQDRNPLDDLSL